LQPYRYSSLDEEIGEIRLVILLPGPFDAPVHALLQTTSFTGDSVPQYEALSYTWGSADDPKTIRVGNAPFDRTVLEVTSNLAKALPYLRHASVRRTLWIDAICVNQQDLQERSSQVKRMPDLYSKAKGVVVWLGPNEPDSAAAMNLLQ
ncbi:heterokaryon incompatibility protein-domain-containing protein, partial [Leptodontidium sp. 2 PMI_412]